MKHIYAAHPSARWWVKADGCDLVSGLEESVRQEWNGDVDMGTGELQALYKEYMDRLSRVLSLLNSRVQDIQNMLREERQHLNQDILFISKGVINFVCMLSLSCVNFSTGGC